MDLTPHVEHIRGQLAIAAEAGGEGPPALPQTLPAPLAPAARPTARLGAAVPLSLLDALPAAADEIPRDLAPGAVELRLRGGEPDFVVTAPAPEGPVEPLEPARQHAAP